MPTDPEHGFNNLAYSALATAIAASDTEIPLIASGAASFLNGWGPSHNLYLALTNASGDIEVVKVTGILNDTLTVERGQDGTTAQAWDVGAIVCQRYTAADATNFLQKGVFLTGSVNPNGVYSVSYPGQKYYEDGPSDCEKRWFIGVSGTTWKILAGLASCAGQPTERSVNISPYYYMTKIKGMDDNGSGTILAVGNWGSYTKWSRCYKSTDHGVTWAEVSKMPNFDDGWFISIAYHGGTWVAVGGDTGATTHAPYIATSTNNGASWTSRSADQSYDRTFLKVRWLKNRFVAVGENGEIQTSADGITWTQRYHDGTGRDIRDVDYDANSGWFYALQSGNYENVARLIRSDDGSTWAWQDTGDPSIRDSAKAITYDSSLQRWVAIIGGNSWSGHADNIYYSLNHGTSWYSYQDLTVGYSIDNIFSYSGTFVAVEGSTSLGIILTSTTGISGWTDVTPSGGGHEYYDVIHDGTNWIVGGYAYGTLAYPSFRTATNPSTWSADGDLNDIYADEVTLAFAAYGGPNHAIIGGERFVATSSVTKPDMQNHGGLVGYTAGTDFTAIDSSFITANSGNVESAVWTGPTNDKWLVAYGVYGIYSTPVTDKVNWTNVTNFVANRLAINYSDYSKVVGVGNGGSHSQGMYSSDYGASWNSVDILSEGSSVYIWGLTFGDGVFIAAGDQGFISLSYTTGQLWHDVTAAGSYAGTFNAACYDPIGGDFYLVGDSGEVQKSTDNGLTWTEVDPGTTEDLKGVAAGGGSVLVVGTNGIMRLMTGGSWQTIDPAGSYTGTFRGAGYYGGHFIAVGDDAEIQEFTVN